jgi:hypothetical protein
LKQVSEVNGSSVLVMNGDGWGESAVGADAELIARLEEGLSMRGAAEIAAPFFPALTSSERGVQAVLLYGSVLWNATRDKTSQPDFIVVVDGLSTWHPRLRDRLWGTVLPPTVYCLRAGDALAKVSVVTAAQLSSQTGVAAKDLHLAGRLSKRVALVWSRDASARQRVLEAKRAALTNVARLTLSRFDGPFDLDNFLKALLGLSYESEVRIVEPGKIAALLDVERDHYRAVGRALLGVLGATPLDATGSRFQVPTGVAAPKAELRRCLRRSRRRAYLRWPKYLATYDGWLDYLLQKLARSGIEVSLTERQRRHPLVFALPVLYQMMRTKRVG